MKKILLALIAVGMIAPAAAAQDVRSFSPSSGAANQTNSNNENTNGNDNRSLSGITEVTDSEYYNIYQPYPMTIDGHADSIQNRWGTLSCQRNSHGFEVRLALPPFIGFKDNNIENGDCIATFEALGDGSQADMLASMIQFYKSLGDDAVSVHEYEKIQLVIFALRQRLDSLFLPELNSQEYQRLLNDKEIDDIKTDLGWNNVHSDAELQYEGKVGTGIQRAPEKEFGEEYYYNEDAERLNQQQTIEPQPVGFRDTNKVDADAVFQNKAPLPPTVLPVN